MKKKILALLLALAAACSLAMPAFAADAASVVYSGSDLTMYENKGESAVFEGILPGETRSETITLENDSDKPAMFYMDAAVLTSLEQSAATVSAGKTTAYTYRLSVNDGATASSIYDSTVGGQNSDGMAALNDDLAIVQAEGGSGNWLQVAQLAPGGKATITFAMALDGAATQNDYNNAAGQLRFQFRVQDMETKTTTRTTTNVIHNVTTVVRSVQTGDYTPILVLAAILAGGFGLMFLLFRKKDNRGAKHTVE